MILYKVFLELYIYVVYLYNQYNTGNLYFSCITILRSTERFYFRTPTFYLRSFVITKGITYLKILRSLLLLLFYIGGPTFFSETYDLKDVVVRHEPFGQT